MSELTPEQISALMSEWGKKGGKANRDKHSTEHFRELGKKGMRIRWEGHQKKAVKELTPDITPADYTPETNIVIQ